MAGVVWLLFLFTGLPGLSAWTLTLSPAGERLQNRRSGDNFFVVCKIKDFDGAASDVKIEWYKDGQQIPRFGSIMTIERTYSSQLMINRPKISDGGKYSCKSEIEGATQEVSAEISFVDPPKFLNVQEEQHPEEGTRASIVCEVEGTDQLEVFWQFNGVTLDETSQRGYNFSEDKQTLYIPHFTAKIDDGIYSCNAAQYSSFETLLVNVTGYARPTITVFDVPNENRGIEGQTIEFKCGAIGKPKPTYRWFFEDDEVPISRSDKHNVDEGLLIIESLNSEDAGSYKCIANNTVGASEKSFELSVFLKPKVDLKHEYVVKENEDVEIVCSYHGEGHVTAKFVSGSREFVIPKSSAVEESVENENENENENEENGTTTEENTSSEKDDSQEDLGKNISEDLDRASNEGFTPNEENQEEESPIQKFKRSAEEHDSDRISVQSEDNKLILKIKNIRLEDAAEYTCAVTNDAGTTKRNTQLGIIHPPTLRHYTGPTVRSLNGKTVSIYCDVSAVPNPKWHWYKNGNEVEANGASIKIDTQSSSTKLTLENMEADDNFGVYTCKADNGVGQLEKQIEVIKVVAPAVPTGTDCKKMMYPNYGKCSFDTEIYAEEESKPQTMDFLLAKFEEMESDYNWNDAQSISVPFEEVVTISDLTPNTQYVVKVRAVNEAGSSEYSDEISFETTDPWAPQSPSHVKMACSEYCTVSWEAPNSHGSPISGYKIKIQEMKMKKEVDHHESTTTESMEDTTEISETNTESTEETTELTRVGEEEDVEEPKNSESEEKENKVYEDNVSIERDSAEILPTDPTTSVERDESEMVSYGNLVVLDIAATENSVQLTNIKPHSYYKVSVVAENAIGQGEPAEIDHQTDENPTKYDQGLESLHLVIGICGAVLFLLLLIDLGCYCSNRCGLIACLCLNVCGKSSRAKKRDLESGGDAPESNRLLDSSGTRFLHPLTTTV
ncbi:unnamed protein product [Caenorhabditis brenneri]